MHELPKTHPYVYHNFLLSEEVIGNGLGSGLDKVPFYSPFASEITIWRGFFLLLFSSILFSFSPKKGNGEWNTEMASKILGQLAIWRIDSKNFIQAWLGSLLIIELCLMQNLKTSGGLTHGSGMSELQRNIWTISMPICATLHQSMQVLVPLKEWRDGSLPSMTDTQLLFF